MTNGIAFFDIAGTLIDGNPWDYVRQHPDIDPVKMRQAIRRFMPVYILNRVRITSDTYFRDRWLRLMAVVFEGWTVDRLEELFHSVFYDMMGHLFRDDVIARLHRHQAQGDKVVLVSGMFTQMMHPVAEKVKVDQILGTQLAIEDGICVGDIVGETCAGKRKLSFIQEYVHQSDTRLQEMPTYAYADSFSDIPLLSFAQHGTATYPDNRLRKYALKSGLPIFPSNTDH